MVCEAKIKIKKMGNQNELYWKKNTNKLLEMQRCKRIGGEKVNFRGKDPSLRLTAISAETYVATELNCFIFLSFLRYRLLVLWICQKNILFWNCSSLMWLWLEGRHSLVLFVVQTNSMNIFLHKFWKQEKKNVLPNRSSCLWWLVFLFCFHFVTS